MNIVENKRIDQWIDDQWSWKESQGTKSDAIHGYGIAESLTSNFLQVNLKSNRLLKRDEWIVVELSITQAKIIQDGLCSLALSLHHFLGFYKIPDTYMKQGQDMKGDFGICWKLE